MAKYYDPRMDIETTTRQETDWENLSPREPIIDSIGDTIVGPSTPVAPTGSRVPLIEEEEPIKSRLPPTIYVPEEPVQIPLPPPKVEPPPPEPPPQTYWNNGLTRAMEPGYPPLDWTYGSDGYWYPPKVEPIGIVPPPRPPVEKETYSSIIPRTLTFTVKMDVGKFPAPVQKRMAVTVSVKPAIPTFIDHVLNIFSKVRIVPIPLPLSNASVEIIGNLIKGKIGKFFDRTRHLKTLLNFGNDYQALVTNWKYDAKDQTGATVDLKLYQPLPADVEEKTQVWISRELSPPVIDRFYVKFTPPPPEKVYLRPANRNIQLTGRTGQVVENATLSSLFSSGAFDPIKQTDRVLEEWYTDDVNSVELNIDYSNYSNFVFFGSARARLQAFIQKLKIIEDYDSILNFNSASLVEAGAPLTSSLSYPALKTISEKRIDIIRSFDPYERFLYYESEIPYSSSFGADVDDQFYYHDDCTWPKISGSVAPIASASYWVETQLAIASAYDAQNQNSLLHSLPQYLAQDVESEDFATFVNMVGHQFDLLKPYIDQMTYIYDRGNDPAKGVSPDLVWNVAEGFGVQLPNQYAINRLVDYTIGEVGAVNPKVYRHAAAETWKRFLHNQIFMMKTKGTKTSLRALANSYGVLPTTLQIREGVISGLDEQSGSFETFEEQTNVLKITSGSYISLPWSESLLNPQTIEMRFSTIDNSEATVLLNADSTWALRLVPTTGSFGKMVLVSGSTVAASSSVLELYSGDFYSLMLRNHPSGTELQIKRAEEASILDASEVQETSPYVSTVFSTPTNLYLGGSGSFFGRPFAGLIDEFRIWGESISDAVFDNHVRYPGLYNGNTVSSAKDQLFVRLSFSKPKNLGGVDKTISNESPYAKNASTNMKQFNAVGFPNITAAPYNMEVIIREVTRYNFNVGASNFTTNQVIIADPPELSYFGDSNIPVLSPIKSMVVPGDKVERKQPTNVVGFYFSITDAINDSIIRSMGNFDLNDLIGDPADQYKSGYKSLETLNRLYWDSYAYNYNVNSFVDFVNNLLEPLFIQARDLIPVRAKLLSGIVHEPHVLERSKIQTKAIKLSAGDYARDGEIQNLEASTITSKPDSIIAELYQQEVNYRVDDIYEIDVVDSLTEAYIRTEEILLPNADFNFTEAAVGMDEGLKLQADVTFTYGTISVEGLTTPVVGFVYYDDLTNLESFKVEILRSFGVDSIEALSGPQLEQFNQQVNTYRSPSTINIKDRYMDDGRRKISEPDNYSILPVISPFTNFDDLDSKLYFTDQNGFVGIPRLSYERIGASVQNERGTWVKGTTYSRDDVVVQENATGDAKFGNGIEFVCVAPEGSIVSHMEPYLDTRNWKAASYRTLTVYDLRKAVVVDGKISLLPTGSAATPAIGYMPSHYKFTRDMRRGIINHQWLGCLQTDSTTVDGKPAVEVTLSGDSILVVNKGGTEPVQQTQPQAGPILDVQ
jgi:hypothetical protein